MHMHNKHGIPPKKGKKNSGEGDHTMADRGSRRKTEERVLQQIERGRQENKMRAEKERENRVAKKGRAAHS
jgi:hypothetical protein